MHHKTPIPTEDDWNDYETDIDTKWAHDQYVGKSLDEVLPYFIVNNVLCAAEDLSHMPAIPFQYYVMTFKRLFLSESVRKDLLEKGEPADASSCFLNLVRNTLVTNSQLIMPVMNELMPVVNYVAENQDLFKVNRHIYGNLKNIRDEIVRLINNEQTGAADGK